jgi:ATP-binding cassette subfamily B protein
MKDLARRFPQFQNAQAAAERIFSLLETAPDIRDATPPATDERLPELRGAVTFENVTFSYNPEEPVLDGLSLLIEAGETVALVGETGAGKTTLASLVCRFYEPTGGRVLIDGRDYREMPLAWLRRNLAIVQQTPHLFSGPVRENIRYGRLDATDAEVAAAARVANAHTFIERLPDGYEFTVGQGGEGLSSGQRQLISLARAVLADPRLLILDEATSAVDTESERLIQQALERVLAGRTSIVIAHRLSTIRRADRIVLIRDGQLVEQGTHRDLIRRRGAYYRLYTSQFVEQREREVLR